MLLKSHSKVSKKFSSNFLQTSSKKLIFYQPKFPTGYSEFVRNLVSTNGLCHPTKFNVLDSMVQSKFSYEVVTAKCGSYSHGPFFSQLLSRGSKWVWKPWESCQTRRSRANRIEPSWCKSCLHHWEGASRRSLYGQKLLRSWHWVATGFFGLVKKFASARNL